MESVLVAWGVPAILSHISANRIGRQRSQRRPRRGSRVFPLPERGFPLFLRRSDARARNCLLWNGKSPAVDLKGVQWVSIELLGLSSCWELMLIQRRLGGLRCLDKLSIDQRSPFSYSNKVHPIDRGDVAAPPHSSSPHHLVCVAQEKRSSMSTTRRICFHAK